MMIPLPPGPFSIVYADPNWQYDNTFTYGGNGGASGQYDVSGYEDIASLPVNQITADDAYLFMWATWPKLCDGTCLPVMLAWGFRPVTCAFLWVKTNPKSGGFRFGQGFYTKANSEFCLLGVKGKPWKETDRISQIIEGEGPPVEIWAPVTLHSEKPAETRRKIVEFCGNVPRLEMFSRHRVDGWTMWGDQVPDYQQLEVPI